MSYEEFWEWMDTCPSKEWFLADDDGEGVNLYFALNAESDDT